MRPHDGVGQGQAHRTLSTGVIAHTLTFHERARADRWMLIANQSVYAGNGRTYGQGNVFAQDGKLLASFAQESMIRRFREEPAGGAVGESAAQGVKGEQGGRGVSTAM
jgi:acyl-CoA thioesterase